MFATHELIKPFGNGAGGSDSNCKQIHCGFGTVDIESELIIPIGLASAYVFCSSSRKSDVGTFKLGLHEAF